VNRNRKPQHANGGFYFGAQNTKVEARNYARFFLSVFGVQGKEPNQWGKILKFKFTIKYFISL